MAVEADLLDARLRDRRPGRVVDPELLGAHQDLDVPVGALALDGEVAEDALRVIRVEYEAIPHITSLEGATEPGAPRARTDSEGEGNIAGEVKTYEWGDPDAGLRQADVVVDQVAVLLGRDPEEIDPTA